MPSQPATTRAEDFFPLAKRLARRHAWNPADVDDLTQEGMLALLIALERTSPENPRAFAQTVLSRTMRGYYNPKRRAVPFYETYDTFSLDILIEGREQPTVQAIEGVISGEGKSPGGQMKGAFRGGWKDHEISPEAPEDEDPFFFDELFIDQYLGDLEEQCGRVARWAVANLLDPGESMQSWILLDMSEDEGERDRCVCMTHRYVREALGYSVPKWFALLRQIRVFTRSWFETHDLI